MQVWAVPFIPDSFTEDLYQLGLAQVDAESQARIKRFYHRADACRGLLGRLLPRVLLKQHGIPRDQITFGKTDAGKPFVSTQKLDKTIGFNVSHDHALVVMVYQIQSDSLGEHHVQGPDVSKIGIDIMKVALPRYDKSLKSFVDNIGDTLTPLERRLLLDPTISSHEGLRRVFLMWTLKEAYTKALGLGLGFDFRRIEYDVPENRLLIDGVVPRGWEFVAFSIEVGGGEQDVYQGVVARYLGGDGEARVQFRECNDVEWFILHDATSLVNRYVEGK